MSDPTWTLRVGGALSAHFKQPSGPSRPGVMWTIRLTRGDEAHVAMVKALLADDATSATRKDDHYQAQTTMQYLDERLRHGWHPAEEEEHTITIGNPLPAADGTGLSARRPWWKLW